MYYSRSGYISLSGKAFTTWLSHNSTPLELLERVVSENQGNMVQLWGFGGGAPSGTDCAPQLFAQYHALEDIGVQVPEPDWKNRRNLTRDQWPEAEQYADRLGAGIVKFVNAAAQKGIYTLLIYTDATPEWSSRLGDAGDYYLGYDFGEKFTFRLDEDHLSENAEKTQSLLKLGDDLMRRVAAHIAERRARGWGRMVATSANFYLDYEVAAGVDIPLAEDFAFRHLNMASALSRGLYRQYELPLWGSHVAHEHYSWIPHASPYKFKLLTAAFYHKLMAGSKIIINESGTWDQQACLCEDAPMHKLPSIDLGRLNCIDPIRTAPYEEEARELFDTVNHKSDVCQSYRRVISDFYDYLKEHGTPKGQPEARIAVVKGNGDLCGGVFNPNDAIGGMFSLAERDSRWYAGAPERGWDIVRDVFFPRPPVLGKWPNHFLSGTPYGMIDIVSFVNDHASADFLSANYSLLIFAGWNTSSEKQYRELCLFVENGGTLFISIPHLSTNATRNYTSYQPEELVHGGDFSRLCGVRVKRKAKRFYWATANPEHSGELGFEFPRRFGIMACSLGDIEIVDESVEVLVVEDETMAPLLLRRRVGKGTVYFLNSWAYPGALNADEGPGAVLNSPGLIGTIFKYLAKDHQGTVSLSSNDGRVGEGCDRISYSYFPESNEVCLQNIDFDSPQNGTLHHGGETIPFKLQPAEFRVLKLAVHTSKPPRKDQDVLVSA